MSVRACSLNCLDGGTCVVQGISVNQKPPGLLQQFDGNSITDTVAAVNLPIEPPNPAICVGNGFVVEVTNLVRPSMLHSDVLAAISAETLT